MNEPAIEASGSKPLRILEIGDELLFKRGVPEQTDFFWIGYKPRAKVSIALGPVAFFRVLCRLRRKQYDLVALHVPLYPPWHPRVVLTVLRDWRLFAPRGLFAVFAWWMIQRFHDVPIAAIDLNDSFGIGRHAFGLIDKSRVYFKRELPADRWLVFFKSGHQNLPGLRWRSIARNKRRLAKLRPISYGSMNAITPVPDGPKTADIFFSGAVDGNSTVRPDGIAELMALRDEGYVVDIPQARIPLEAFHERIARAWLAWSPGGLGWDCGRHYEIASVGTVPLMNYPTIYLDAPFIEGEHCVFYGPEPGGLARAIRLALADKPRLARMAAAARAHATTHHSGRARAERIAVAVLGRRLDGTPAPDPAGADGQR